MSPPVDTPEVQFRKWEAIWKKETRIHSSLSVIVEHWAYQAIIGLGEAAVPLILKELQESPDHWFVALVTITGEDQAKHGYPNLNFDQAAEIWIEWGRENGYI